MSKGKPSTPPVPPEVVRFFQRKNAEREMLSQAGIRIPLVPPIIFKGEGVRAFGSRVYAHRPVEETFHDFLISILHTTLGKEWWDTQRTLQPEKRHFVAKCFEKYQEWMDRNKDSAPRIGKTNIFVAPPDGYVKTLLLLAFDVVSLSHTGKLPEPLLERLRSHDQYQGARYEVAIAAIFARLQTDITFTDEKSDTKRCEFVAKSHKPEFSLAVEAKSRHRQGVLNQDGDAPGDEQLMSARAVWRLFKDALEQNPKDVPYMIFIDVNAPLTPQTPTDDKQWVKDAKELVVSKLKTLSPEEHPAAVFFTNFSYHYQTENEAQHGEVIGIYTTQNPKFPPLDPAFTASLQGALNHYGFVPPVELEEDPSRTGVPTIYDEA